MRVNHCGDILYIILPRPILNSLTTYQRVQGATTKRALFARRMSPQEKFLFGHPNNSVFLESSIG
jgi:hypothetical protein